MNCQYQKFKGREIDFTQPVRIYKNLHNGLFSIKQKELVVAHVRTFEITDVDFKVNESGRQRVVLEKKKNVHAFVCGRLLKVNVEYKIGRFWVKTTYNPYKLPYFYHPEDMEEADMSSDEVLIGTEQGLFIRLGE